MTAAMPTTVARATAGMIGVVVGAQLGLEPVPDAAAPHGVRPGPVPPDSPYPAAAAVALEAARAFAGGRPDLQGFAAALARWDTHDGRGASEGLHAALQHLHLHGTPSLQPHGPIGEPVLAGLPIGIVARASARNIISATTHAVALLAPEPATVQAAVAIAVAAAHLASGHRDLVPEVLAALRAEGAEEALLAAIRHVPVTRAEGLQLLLAGLVPAHAVATAALWLAEREPIAPRGAAVLALGALHPVVRSAAVAAGLGLAGLRDGERAVPEVWTSGLAAVGEAADLGRRAAGEG